MLRKSLDLFENRYTLFGHSEFEAKDCKGDFLFSFDYGEDLKSKLESMKAVKYDTYSVIDFEWRNITSYNQLREVGLDYNAADASITFIEQDNVPLKLKYLNRIHELEEIIFSIANIDTVFMNTDGTERPFDEKEALDLIDKMVIPIWNKHCDDKINQADLDDDELDKLLFE